MKNCFKALVVGKGDFMRDVPQLSRILVFSLLSFWGNIKAYSQFQKPDVNMPSPNAASLGLYGEVPVSLYTGTPNIEIPVYTLQEGKIKIPISLSYHASGVRVNQHPGWVGLNWNLNAGGAITRVVKGAEDEFQPTTNPTSNTNAYYMYGYSQLNSTNWNTMTYSKDTEPDEFTFNFAGYSGKFYYDHNGQWKTKCDAPVRINLLTPVMLATPTDLQLKSGIGKDQANYFAGFEITTPEGITYTFGGTTNAIEYTKPFFKQRESFWVANTWYLTKIKTPQGQEVNFNYQVFSGTDGKFICSLSPSVYYKQRTGDAATCPTTAIPINQTPLYNGSLIRPCYLLSITSASTSIFFDVSNSNEMRYEQRICNENIARLVPTTESDAPSKYNLYLSHLFPNSESGETQMGTDSNPFNRMQWKKLERIRVSGGGGPAANVSFVFDENQSKRLLLKRVKYNDLTPNSMCSNNYDLSYYEDYTLPGYLDTGDQTDHWGFFSKNSFNLKTLEPSYVSTFASHKEASSDINVLRSGLLSKIVYPTGGYTELEYEPHTFSKYLNVDQATGNTTLTLNSSNLRIGGVRIKKLTISDNDRINTKNYTYTENAGVSSGISAGIHSYQQIFSGAFKYYSTIPTFPWGSKPTPDTYFTDIITSYQNILPMGVNAFGNPIGYKTVTETNADLSYTVYQYTNYETNYPNAADKTKHMDESIPISSRIYTQAGVYDPRIDLSFERGQLISQESYSASQKLTYKKTLTYKRLSTDFVRMVLNSVQPCGTGVAYGSLPYKGYTYCFRPETETVNQYDQVDATKFTTDVTDYLAYNVLGMPIQIRTTRNGKSTTVFNKYAIDFTFPEVNCQTQLTNCYTQFNCGSDQGCQTYCQQLINSSCINGLAKNADAQALFDLQQMGATSTLIEQFNVNNDGTDNTQKVVDGFINLYRSTYTKNTNAYNTQIYQTLQYVPTILKTLLPSGTTYDSSIYFKPSSVIYNFNNTFQFGLDKDPKFLKNVIEFSNYTTLGEPMQFKGVDGVWNKFTWGTGAETGKLKSKTIGDGTSLAQTTNFSYSNPLVGVSQITDPNNFATKYEYDGFNRLKVVRDYSNNLIKSYSYNLKNSSPFSLTIINIGQSQVRTMPGSNVPMSAWGSNFVTVDAGPDLDNSTQSNPSIFYTNNSNKGAPRFWTIYVGPCNLGTSGAIGYDMLLSQPETGAVQSFNTIENNAAYLMYANSDNFTTLYAQNHPTYGFTTATGSNPTNLYDSGLPKGLYKLVIRYWSQKGTGAWPSIRTPLGVVLAIKEYWFRIQSQQGIGQGPP